MTPLLDVQGLVKEYRRGLLRRLVTFRLEAEFTLAEPAIVGVMGPNGSGKTTLFELITGGNRPTGGRVLCAGRDIHAVRPDQRDRLAIHYHQAYQVRHFHSLKPAFLMQRADRTYPLIHLFDEPQFSTQDGYIGFMLDFFRQLQTKRLPGAALPAPERALPDRDLAGGLRALPVRVSGQRDAGAPFDALLEDARVRAYLGRLGDPYWPPGRLRPARRPRDRQPRQLGLRGASLWSGGRLVRSDGAGARRGRASKRAAAARTIVPRAAGSLSEASQRTLLNHKEPGSRLSD